MESPMRGGTDPFHEREKKKKIYNLARVNQQIEQDKTGGKVNKLSQQFPCGGELKN